jgi:aminoglycoside phosphotransferase (APT) family kinase protein
VTTETPPEPSLLTLDDVPAFLLREQLLSPEVFVDDTALDIQDRSRRNANFSVIPSQGRRLLIKQPQATRGSAARPLVTEARILQLVEEDARLARMRHCTPRFHYFDEPAKILVVELLHPATSLLKFHLNGGEVQFPPEAAQAVAACLADAHEALQAAHAAGLMEFVPKARAGVFGWEESSLTQWDDLNQARKSLVRTLAAERLLDDREEMAQLMAQHSVPCHNDARWDNFLVLAGEGPGGGLNLRIIDWEAATLGDVAYDVAFFVGEYYRFWTGTAVFGDDPLGEPKRQAFRLPDAHPAIAAFLDAYLARRGLAGAAAADFRRRVVRYLPYALITQAFEASQRANQTPPNAARALHDAAALKRDPARLAALFGLEAPHG